MKIIPEYNGFKANQLVLDANNTLARIVYIEIDDDMSEKYEREIVFVRLALINESGFEFANCTNDIKSLKPYLIPTKTLNPSEERGFDITRLSILIENLQKDKYFVRNNSKEYKYGFEHALILVKGSINDILAYQANGEKPEVVNPVGQDDLRKTIEILLMYYSEANGGTTDNIQEYTDKFLKAIKPRETDKEEPKTKYYEYKTSLHTDLLTANNPENKHLIHWKRVRVPSNHNSINDTMFIEFITGDFVLDLRVIDKF